MKKKIKPGATEMTYVWLALVCNRCGAKLGEIYRLAGQHPAAGEEKMQSSCGTRVERPDGGITLNSRCSRCGATPQTRWERIGSALDELRHDGVAWSELRV